jgi:outer membrane protein assembly factor BamE (lipoprotein component of BamABCDE complex)
MKYLNSSSLAVVLGSATLLSFLSGCASMSGAESNRNLNKLKYGMSESQVLNILGTPDSVVRKSETEDRWVYDFRREDKAGRNLYIQFDQNALTKTGELNGREVAAEEPNRVPGTCTQHVFHEMVQESACVK